MLKFKKYLEETNRAPNTRCSYFNAVRSFYRSQGIQIPDIKMPKGDICLEENYAKLLTKDDIRKMIDVSSPRDRRNYLCYVSFGHEPNRNAKTQHRKILRCN